MTRRLAYEIDKQHSGMRIGDYLRQRAYSRAVMIELKKTPQGIQKNGAWAGVNDVLKEGDLLTICLEEGASSEKIIPTQATLDILYEDEDLLVVNKGYDTPIHPSLNNYENTLANQVMYYYAKQNQPHTFRCINRLDRDTTGVTVIAKNLLSASILSNQMMMRQLGRTYVAFVEGKVEAEGTINLPIGRAEGSIIERQIDHEKGQEAVTHFKRLGVGVCDGKDISAVALRLDTGRTHQIRVHMAALGHPLLGDFLYNPQNHMLTRQALHGARCCLTHPITGEKMQFITPLPKDMKNFMSIDLCKLFVEPFTI